MTLLSILCASESIAFARAEGNASFVGHAGSGSVGGAIQVTRRVVGVTTEILRRKSGCPWDCCHGTAGGRGGGGCGDEGRSRRRSRVGVGRERSCRVWGNRASGSGDGIEHGRRGARCGRNG